jgi:cytoskeleton protein RodZ
MADIGTTLREARMRAKIDISEVETRTKIRAKYLRAIENEEWDLLPGPVYVKSFLRTYGDYLGLDSRALIDDYKRRYERPSDQELRPIATLSRERERAARGPLLPPWAIIAAVLVIVVVVLYVVGTLNNKSKPTPATGLHPVTHHAQPARHRRTRRTKSAATTARSAKLQLVPTGTVYVCVVDGAGRKLVPGQIFSAGQTVPTETAPKLLVTLGNASIQMKLNGKPVPITASSGSIGFSLTSSGARSLPLSKQPTCR